MCLAPAGPDAPAAEVTIPDDVVWVKCYDPANAAFYYLHYGTEESAWEIPASTNPSGALCPS